MNENKFVMLNAMHVHCTVQYLDMVLIFLNCTHGTCFSSIFSYFYINMHTHKKMFLKANTTVEKPPFIEILSYCRPNQTEAHLHAETQQCDIIILYSTVLYTHDSLDLAVNLKNGPARQNQEGSFLERSRWDEKGLLDILS